MPVVEVAAPRGMQEARNRMIRKRAEMAKRVHDAAGTGHSADVQHGDWDVHPHMGKCAARSMAAKACVDWSNIRGFGNDALCSTR